MSKGHSTQGSKIPFISNLKKPACASKPDILELTTLRYTFIETFMSRKHENLKKKSCENVKGE